MKEISSAAIEEVSASSTEVVTAVDNVAAITEENTAATEQMSANSIQVHNEENVSIFLLKPVANLIFSHKYLRGCPINMYPIE